MPSYLLPQRLKFLKLLGKLLAVSNAAVLLINLFVGSLVYQNPFMPLADIKNVLFVLLVGTLFAFALFALYRIIQYLENNGQIKSLPSNSTVAPQ